MSLRVRIGLALFVLLSTSSFAQSWDFHLNDTAGGRHSLSDFTGHKAAVLFFLGVDCPVSNRYAPEIQRIVDGYSRQGVAFEMVYSDPDLKSVEINQHDREFGLRMPALLDPEQRLAAKMGVTITPTVVVLSASGEVQYRGRIDDRYVDLATYREIPLHRDLRQVLDAVLTGGRITEASTQSVGCFLPPPRKPRQER